MNNTLNRNKSELTGILCIEKINLLEQIKDKTLWQEYRKRYKAASELELETNFPIQIDFELNATCNLRCPMCPLSVESKKRNVVPLVQRKTASKRIDTCSKIAKKIYDDIASYHDEQYAYIPSISKIG